MTELETIFEEFKDKITDYDLAEYKSSLQEEVCLSYLKKAVARFKRICKSDLNGLNEFGFEDDLSDEEIDILTEWMVYFWLKPIRNDIDNMRSVLNTKDFSQISPANLLTAINTVYEDSRKRARSLMNEYSYLDGGISKLKPRQH